MLACHSTPPTARSVSNFGPYNVTFSRRHRTLAAARRERRAGADAHRSITGWLNVARERRASVLPRSAIIESHLPLSVTDRRHLTCRWLPAAASRRRRPSCAHLGRDRCTYDGKTARLYLDGREVVRKLGATRAGAESRAVALAADRHHFGGSLAQFQIPRMC